MIIKSVGWRATIATGLFAALLGPLWIFSAEIEDTYKNAFDTFLQGRLIDSDSAYHYLDTLGIEQATPVVNLALLARDMNQPEEALPLWIKASLLLPTNAFVWNQRGWCYLSLQRYNEARNSFRKAVDVSSTTLWSTEAQFGLGLTEVLDGSPRTATSYFRLAFSGNPYIFPAVAAQLADLSLRRKEHTTAEVLLKHSINQDPVQPDILERLAQVYEKNKSPKAAWVAYKMLADMDPQNTQATAGMERMEKYIETRPEQLLFVRRLAAPLLQKPVEIPPSNPIRVGVFARPSGDLSYLRRVFFVAGSDFRIIDPKLGEVTQGKPYEQWELIIPPESLVVEIRDVHHQLQFTTKQSFYIELSSPNASVLLKSPGIQDIQGVDIGDRELRGTVEFNPTPFGFQVVNEIGMEEYLFSIVSANMPRGTPMEALEAQAILARTKLASLKQHAQPSSHVDLCDSNHCRLYAGLSEEREDATQSVLATFGGKLYRAKGRELYPVQQHLFCGWSTDEGAVDRTSGTPGIRSVWDMELLTHGAPDPERYDELWPLPTANWSRWVRVFDADDLRHRIEKIKYIGKLTGLKVMRRSSSGRILALEVQGLKDNVLLEGERAISDFFSPGGLRSTLMTIQPLYRSRKLRQVILWGAGTGDGRGLCTAGAMGMAYTGKDYRAILSHYFPNSEIRDMEPKITLPKKEAQRPGGSKQPVAELLKRKRATESSEAERRLGARWLRERNKRRAQEAFRKAAEEKIAASTATLISTTTVPSDAEAPPKTEPE